MSKYKLVLLVLAAVMAFFVGFGSTAQAFHAPNHGYFKGGSESGSWLNIWPASGGQSGCRGNGNALPTWVNTAQEFIDFTFCKLGGNTQERIGAAFIISTMTGKKDITPNAAQRADFAARVNYAASKGWINWSASIACNRSSPPRNSFYQSTRQDAAWFWSCPNGPGGSIATSAVTFYNGSSTYILMRYCANPVGSMPALAEGLDFNMSGRSTVNDTTVLPGQTITFRHYLRNSGPTGTSPTSIDYRIRNTISGGITLSGNAGTFADDQEKRVRTHNVTVPAGADPGSQICRRVEWNPDTENGGSGQGAPACATVQYNFDLTPTVNAVITSGGSPITGNVAEPGDTITFTYAVNNSGSTVSQSVTCTYRQATHAGYNESPPGDPFTPPGANCPPPRTFPAGSNTTTAVETAPAASANTTICKSFTVSPATHNGGSASDQACVLVAAKPYTRVWGGDVSAGNGLADTSGVCTNNNSAAIIGWNKRGSGNYSGAGAQFAVYALSRITDFASALYDPGGADVPTGLSFANTTSNPNNGHFGGNLGSAPCIPNYYAERPSSGATVLGPSVNVTSLGSGTYVRDGPLTLGAGGGVMNVNPGESITIYVDGDVRITSSIRYPGNWNTGNIPMFRLIAQGNIYVENSVGELSGVYIAQANNSGNGGQIHTCATGFSAVPLGGAVYSACNQQLTVNGVFIADQVRLLRTNGSLAQSLDAEPNNSGNVAEIFNFGPGVWIPQPADGSGGSSPDYDAIISLPPVL